MYDLRLRKLGVGDEVLYPNYGNVGRSEGVIVKCTKKKNTRQELILVKKKSYKWYQRSTILVPEWDLLRNNLEDRI